MVEAVVVESIPLDAYNLSVDEYATYFVAGAEGADAVWVHNNCYDRGPNGEPPEGFVATGTTNSQNQPTLTSPDDGRELYRGHDGRYYDPIAHPPTPAPPRYTIGVNDGGPGLWQVENGLSPSNAAYQAKVTGSPDG